MFCIVQASVVFYELHIGFGKTGDLIDTSEIEPMEKVGSINLGLRERLPDVSYNRPFMQVISCTFPLLLSQNCRQPSSFCG